MPDSNHTSSHHTAGWRDAFASLAEVAPQSYTPVALGFELVEVVARTWFEPKHTVVLEKQEVSPGTDPSLAIRPLVLSESGNWVKKSLTWRTIDRMARQFSVDPRHQEWFTQLAGLRTRDKTDFTPDGAPYNLGDFHTPLLWDMFAQATELGIELVGVNQGMNVHIGREAKAIIDVNRVKNQLRVQPRVSIDEREFSPGLTKPIWMHGFFGVDLRSGFTVTLAPAAKATAQSALSVFAAPGPIAIPASESEEFFEEYYPLLRTSAEVVSTDETVKFPRFSQPQLVLFMVYGAKDHLSLQWYWEYTGPRRTLPVVPLSKLGTSAIRSTAAGRATAGTRGTANPPTMATPDPRDNRDLEHEGSVLGQVESVLAETQPPGHPRDMELTDVDTADFVVNALPELEEIEHVKVITRGKKQPYRELGGEPNITITSVESEKNDWFDLGFQISVDGHPVPFVKLFKALASGTKKIKLVDDTFLSLNKPAFDKIKALLAEADLIPEWEPESPKIARLHAGLWAEFEDLADESLPAQSWRESAQALLDLDQLPATRVPALGGVTMRPYQVQGFRWLALLHRCHLGGVLADDMGLGKTLQTLALIVHVKAEAAASSDAGPHLPFLVVAPTSVVDNWAKEAAKFTPDIDVRVVAESTRKRQKPLAEVAAGADVIVMSYAMLRLDEDPISRLEWAGFVLDEAQFVKNSSSQVHQAAKSVNAPFRLALTGTPMENSLRDMWSIFAITAPGLFPSAHRFDEEYVRPIEGGENPGRMGRLQRRIKPFMLRRTKDLVAADLPEKQEQVINVELNAAHRTLYDRVLQKERKKILGFIDSDYDKQRFIVFRSLTLLRMLALDPRIVDGEHEGVPSSKLAALMDRLEDVVAEGHRSIVFSQFTSFLTKITEDLARRGVPYVLLDGSTRNRGQVVEAFRTGEAPVFLISLKAGGFGLNLTEADYVFLMDPWWNPATENQAIDRAHRIGQTKNVMVYRYVAEGTIEEKVLALQKKKAELFDSLMTDGQNFDGQAFSQTVTAEDIRGLFEG
ncbi:Superfamily II DNA or RNA helicase, SNF2 family [Brevibacterium sandarakinum]|uniref:Superfamily II DNA or RNA helicase, SNF2 family n=1 Tax=Brevibacterium sandarakinum TaxID=629680 RepID=A0A1H1QQ92_BRESA|nr:DEAD/DEAH box helicase [Brevibacterium sandarakinum]SDS25527.1 Superfamily II DNA or RNA helicase, SNF2 family [Brevibacterium sandarakinum]